MSAEILVRLEGETEPRPLRDLTWETIAPCGCTCGLALAEYIGHDYDTAMTRLEPNAEQRRRDAAAGYVVRLVPHSESADRFSAQCHHDPKWGRDSAPVPDGYCWGEAAQDARRQHLVPVPADTEKRWVEWAAPLCGGKRDLFQKGWRLPTCRSCEKRARALAAEAVSS